MTGFSIFVSIDVGGLLIFLLPYTVCVVGPDVAKVFKSSRRYYSKSTFTKNTNDSHLNPTSVWVEIPHCKEMAGRRKRSKSKRIFERRKPKYVPSRLALFYLRR